MTCPVCLSASTHLAGTIDRFDPPYPVRVCNDCGSSYRHPLPEDDAAWYDEKYYSGAADFSYIDERNHFDDSMEVWRARLKTIRLFEKSGRFLDVGCSFGGLVQAASSHFDAYGLDVSPFAVKEGNAFAKSREVGPSFRGLFQGTLSQELPEEIAKGGFSVITMIEVAEHLRDARSDFATLHRLLKPGGLLVVQTANMDGLQAQKAGLDYHYYLPGHLVCYTARGLKEMLESLGFCVEKEFIPVDFGLLPKLKKMRGTFTRPLDYLKWFRTSWYHLKSLFRRHGRPLTSSYVLYVRRLQAAQNSPANV